MVELADKYVLTSKRESGFGRYDVMLEPRQEKGASDSSGLDAIINNCGRDAIIIEFKVLDPDEEEELADTVREALNQIEKKQYEAVLRARGIPLKDYIEERAIGIANYIIDNNATVRQTAKAYGVSKSTVHMVVTKWNGMYGE